MAATTFEPDADADEAPPGTCSCGRDDLLDGHDWQPGCDDPYPLDGIVTLDYMMSIPGMTYRRLDYWVRVGLLEPANPVPGTGYPRLWTYRDYEVARHILCLTNAGLSLHVAADAAVAKVDGDKDTLHIAGTVTGLPGVSITWHVDGE